jgi:hypothetical protein
MTTNYINNPEFLKALIDHKAKIAKCRESNLEDPPLSNYIGECFWKIAENYGRDRKFNQYSYLDEMKMDAVENCIRYFKNFNPEITENPFAYFSQITFYAFLRRIQKEKKEQYTKYKIAEHLGVTDQFELVENEDGVSKHFKLYENLSEFIEQYEDSQKKKVKTTERRPVGLELFLEDWRIDE